MMKWLRVILGVILTLVVILVAGFLLWAYDTNPVMAEALAALETDDAVQVDRTRWIVFSPSGHTPDTGVIFYPGGRIDPRAYAPVIRALAEDGYLAVIVPMPLNLAITSVNRADDVIAAYPGIRTWYVGGHSLGGAIAATYISNHPDQGLGLYLFASYPAESVDLSAYDGPVQAIFVSEDGLTRVQQGVERLPPSIQIVVIQGDNHAQFGYYGLQDGDGTATISRAQQQEQVIAALLGFFGE